MKDRFVQAAKVVMWLGRLANAALFAVVALVFAAGACAMPVLHVQTVLSERALDNYMKRAVDGAVDFRQKLGRLPTQLELDAISEAVADKQFVQNFQLVVAGSYSQMPQGGFHLKFERESGAAVVESWTRHGTMDTSWLSHASDTFGFMAFFSFLAMLFGAAAVDMMPPMERGRRRLLFPK